MLVSSTICACETERTSNVGVAILAKKNHTDYGIDLYRAPTAGQSPTDDARHTSKDLITIN